MPARSGSANRPRGWRGIARRLGYLPPCLLLLLASYHVWLVHTQHLSRWLGGGFGMFSTTDVGSSRLVRVFAVTGSTRQALELSPAVREHEERFRGLPSAALSRPLAGALFASKVRGECAPDTRSCPVDALLVGLWRLDWQPDTLAARESLLASHRHPVTALWASSP